MRLALGSLLAAAVFAGAVAPGAQALPPIRHVFVIVLENESESSTFGAHPPAPYLGTTLRSEGAFVPNYYGTGHESNDNYISMISGQAPNPQNQSDCQVFTDFQPGTIGPNGQAIGSGCVYPSSVKTIADQLESAGFTWRDYNQSMGADPSREPAVCAHPAINQRDGTQSATATDEYATRHNPFVYFHSIIDDTARCDSHVVNLNALPQDLQSAASTPNYVFITPDLCGDGHDATCADKSRPGGFAGIDAFLKQWVPMITGSPAYQQGNGLLAIIFDEASTSDTSSCCGEIPGPNSPSPGVNGPGGGQTGAVLLSPCIKPGTVTTAPYNHYSLLRSTEDIFGLGHLGYAQLSGEQSFGSDIFDASCGMPATGPKAGPKVSIRAPALASDASRTPRAQIRWTSSAAGARYIVQVRRTSTPASPWRTLLSGTTRRSLVFRGRLGATYEFRVSTTVTIRTATAMLVIPSATRVRGGAYHGRWHRVRLRQAWKGHAEIGSPGASFTLSYKGATVFLIGQIGPRQGTARVTVDGRALTINLNSSGARARQVVFSRALRVRHHHLRLVVLSGTIALEGVGIENRAR